MAQYSNIEWTDRTWNPTRGCSRVSEGCRHCYAEGVAARFSRPGLPYAGLAERTARGPHWTGKVRLVPSALQEPLWWSKPERVFVNSMSDLFHEGFTDEEIAAVFGVMALRKHLTFQVLTKRSARMQQWFEWLQEEAAFHDGGVYDVIFSAAAQRVESKERWEKLLLESGLGERDHGLTEPWPLPNVWLGVSVEDQANDHRIGDLIATPAAVRFLSCEPLLGPLDLSPYLGTAFDGAEAYAYSHSIDWVIVGGESGHSARPFDIAWARDLVHQCTLAAVPVFIKQLGHQPIERYGVAFGTHASWVNKAPTLLIKTDLCFDAKGRACRLGIDFARARDEGAFPVGIWRRVITSTRKGGVMADWPSDLRVRQFPEVK
jgi:protein gp37